MISEQPKLVNPGVADIPLDNGPNEELGGPQEVKEKPSYVMSAAAARRRAGLDVESEPCQSQGVELCADDVIVIDDDGNEVQVEVPPPEAPSLSIKMEHGDIPQDFEEPAEPVLRRSTRNRVQRQLFSPRYHERTVSQDRWICGIGGRFQEWHSPR